MKYITYQSKGNLKERKIQTHPKACTCLAKVTRQLKLDQQKFDLSRWRPGAMYSILA